MTVLGYKVGYGFNIYEDLQKGSFKLLRSTIGYGTNRQTAKEDALRKAKEMYPTTKISVMSVNQGSEVNKMISLGFVCPLCEEEYYVNVKEEDYIAWLAGADAAIVFPYLTETEIECLISWLCSGCQKRVFGY